jgi:hypothetical protein
VTLSIVVILTLDAQEFMMMAELEVTFVHWLKGSCCLGPQMMMNRSFNALNM